MSDSTTHLDEIASSQAAKEVTANALFNAMSQNALFGRRARTTTGLTWGYYGGKYRKADGTVLTVANGTVALTDGATNYLLETDGAVSKVTAAPTDWPGPLAASANALYEIVCAGGAVTGYTDYRAPTRGLTGAAGAVGATGPTGATGASGAGVPAGGTTGQQLRKTSGTDYATDWVTEPFDVTAFYPGIPGAAAVVLRVPVARAVTFPGDFSGSYGKASANAAAATDIDIQKNGVSCGTISFALGASSATFVSSGGAVVNFAAGDVLSVIAPASPDATLADVGIVLAGSR